MQAAVAGIAISSALNVSLILGVVITYYVMNQKVLECEKTCPKPQTGGYLDTTDTESYIDKKILQKYCSSHKDNPIL
jgi:hypothetical protein